MNIGNKLKNIRKDKELSIEEVSDILKINKNIIRRWEKGYSIPSIKEMIDICKLYNISIEELFI